MLAWSSLRGLSVSAPSTTCIYTLSLHDALPISTMPVDGFTRLPSVRRVASVPGRAIRLAKLMMDSCHFAAEDVTVRTSDRSEEHTSELQSHSDLVCRLQREKNNDIDVCRELRGV